MGQFSKVQLAIDNAHTVPQNPGLWTRHGGLNQLSHSIYLK